MRTLLGLSLLFLAAAGCGVAPEATKPAPQMKMADQSPPALTAEKRTIIIDNFAFDPPEATVPVGAKVTWVNHDDVPHTATSTAKPKVFDTGALDTDQQYSHVFTAAGEYEYFCAVHPHMTGRIIVK